MFNLPVLKPGNEMFPQQGRFWFPFAQYYRQISCLGEGPRLRPLESP